MRLFCLLLLLMFGAGLYLYCEDMRQDRQREQEIRVLQTKVDALQLVTSGKAEVPVFDGVMVIQPKVVKPRGIRY